MSEVKFVECYWTTTNNKKISEVQKISDYVMVENDLFLGGAEDYVGNEYGKHIICGTILNGIIHIVDVTDYHLQNPHYYQFPFHESVDFNKNFILNVQ